MKKSDIEVELIDHMGTDLSVVNAARVSMNKRSKFDENGELVIADKKLINYLSTEGHWTPFAHTCISLRIKLPFFIWNQLRKHQTGAVVNEVSRRYVKTEPEFWFPEKLRESAPNIKQGSYQDRYIVDPNIDMEGVAENCLMCYNYMLSQGVCAEQARIILPQNTMTEIIWTGSLSFWGRVCSQRLDVHAQYETRLVAKEIYNIMRKLYPNSWEALMKNVNIDNTK